jgi:hypothetical protein
VTPTYEDPIYWALEEGSYRKFRPFKVNLKDCGRHKLAMLLEKA